MVVVYVSKTIASCEETHPPNVPAGLVPRIDLAANVVVAARSHIAEQRRFGIAQQLSNLSFGIAFAAARNEQD